MTGTRRARITLLTTALAVWSAAVAGPLASAGSAETQQQPPVATPAARTVDLRVESPMTMAVDPDTRDGKAHHPLKLQVQSLGIDAQPLVTSASPSGYDPATIKKYLGLSGTGLKQIIAIVTAYDAPTLAADLAVFNARFGLPAPPLLKKVSQTGSTTLLPPVDANWALETSLDVQWAHALAPAASIYVVEAKSSSLADLNIAIDYAALRLKATVISNSWGIAGEIPNESAYDYHCKLTTAVCVFSTGDTGNPGGYPAYNPWVVSVGGTTLNLATDPLTGDVSVASESAWAGSGGGASALEAKPSYQTAFGAATTRGIPDVSYNADPQTGFPVYDSTPFNGSSGWFQMGGTSAGAPQWAAIIAVANQQRLAKRKTVLAAYNSRAVPNFKAGTILYGLTSGLADITDGPSNGPCGDLCTLSVGYDYITGLGSPRKGIDTALVNAP